MSIYNLEKVKFENLPKISVTLKNKSNPIKNTKG